MFLENQTMKTVVNFKQDCYFMTDLSILKSTIETVKELGSVLSSVKDKIWGNEDAAYDRLSEALEEIAKFFEAVQKEISNYQSLEFSDPKDLRDNKVVLYDLEGGMMAARIESARGHCHKIKLIYDNYLEKWFRSVFGSQKEYNDLNNLFMELSVHDANMFQATEQLETFLKNEATAVLDFVNAKDYAGADRQILSSRGVLSPTRQSISELLRTIMGLRNDFLKVSGKV